MKARMPEFLRCFLQGELISTALRQVAHFELQALSNDRRRGQIIGKSSLQLSLSVAWLVVRPDFVGKRRLCENQRQRRFADGKVNNILKDSP